MKIALQLTLGRNSLLFLFLTLFPTLWVRKCSGRNQQLSSLSPDRDLDTFTLQVSALQPVLGPKGGCSARVLEVVGLPEASHRLPLWSGPGVKKPTKMKSHPWITWNTWPEGLLVVSFQIHLKP